MYYSYYQTSVPASTFSAAQLDVHIYGHGEDLLPQVLERHNLVS